MMKKNFIADYIHGGQKDKAKLLSDSLDVKLYHKDRTQKLLNNFNWYYKLHLFTEYNEKAKLRSIILQLLKDRKQENLFLIYFQIFAIRSFLESNGLIEILPYADALNLELAKIIGMANDDSLDLKPLYNPMALNIYVSDICTALMNKYNLQLI